jgi:hypothetical protein
MSPLTARQAYPTITRSEWFLAQLWTETRSAHTQLQTADGPWEIAAASTNLYQLKRIANDFGLTERIAQYDWADTAPQNAALVGDIPRPISAVSTVGLVA